MSDFQSKLVTKLLPCQLRCEFHNDGRENARAQFEHWIDWERSARRGDYERLMGRLTGDAKDRFQLPPAAVTRVLIHALEPLGLMFAEEPCHPENDDAVLNIARATTVPI